MGEEPQKHLGAMGEEPHKHLGAMGEEPQKPLGAMGEEPQKHLGAMGEEPQKHLGAMDFEDCLALLWVSNLKSKLTTRHSMISLSHDSSTASRTQVVLLNMRRYIPILPPSEECFDCSFFLLFLTSYTWEDLGPINGMLPNTKMLSFNNIFGVRAKYCIHRKCTVCRNITTEILLF